MNKILLIHQYAGNKGDRAVLYALCRVLLSNNAKTNIIVSTSDPDLWADYAYYKEHNVNFIHNSWHFPEHGWYWKILNHIKKYTFTIQRELFLSNLHRIFGRLFINPEFFKVCKSSDIVISVGGHHFTTILSRDLVSSINYDTISTFVCNKPLYCISQSYGPFIFHNKRNQKLTSCLLEKAQALCVRDQKSIQSLKGLGVNGNFISLPESVISLNSVFTEYTAPSKRKQIIGIAVYVTQKRSEKEQNHYIETFSKICNLKIAEGYHIHFFPMELKGTPPDDRWCIKEIVCRIEKKENVTIIDKDLESYDHIKIVSQCRLFIGHKTHSVIFSLTSGTPTIALAYHPKTIDFMEQFQLKDYALNDKDFTVENVIDRIRTMEKNIDEIGTHIFQTARRLDNEFVTIFKQLLN